MQIRKNGHTARYTLQQVVVMYDASYEADDEAADEAADDYGDERGAAAASCLQRSWRAFVDRLAASSS
jgi:hypothetical protein